MNAVILGAGAWGTAMGLHLGRLGHRVVLLPRRPEHAMAILDAGENEQYLAGCPLGADVQIGFELAPALLEADLVVLACPSFALRGACAEVLEHLDARGKPQMVLALCKGLDPEALRLPSELMAEVLGDLPHGVFSGPNYAREVAMGQPAAAVLASEFAGVERLCGELSGGGFRVFGSQDAFGVGLGGCLKNVYAIGAGLVDGLGLGDNAKAALLTRSLKEMVTLGIALGARVETLYGLSGFGDLVATCYGSWSRNYRFGAALGQGGGAQELRGGSAEQDGAEGGSSRGTGGNVSNGGAVASGGVSSGGAFAAGGVSNGGALQNGGDHGNVSESGTLKQGKGGAVASGKGNGGDAADGGAFAEGGLRDVSNGDAKVSACREGVSAQSEAGGGSGENPAGGGDGSGGRSGEAAGGSLGNPAGNAGGLRGHLGEAGGGSGENPAAASLGASGVVEGFWTAKCFYERAHQESCSMPVLEAIFRILHEGLDATRGIQSIFEGDFELEAGKAERQGA